MRLRSSACLVLALFPMVVVVTAHRQDPPDDEPEPRPAPHIQRPLDEAAAAFDRGDSTDALARADQVLAAARQSGDRTGEAHAQRLRATCLQKLDRNPEARTAWEGVEAAWKDVAEGPGQIEAIGWQAILDRGPDAGRSRDLLQKAIRLAEQEARRPRKAASSLLALVRLLIERSRLAEARPVVEAATALAERLSPSGLLLAEALNTFGMLEYSRDNLPAARARFQRAFEIREALAPDSLHVASSLTSLGNLTDLQGDLRAAREYHRRAIAIKERLEPDSLSLANSLNNLANTVRRLGELESARQYYARALTIREKRAPGSTALAGTLIGMGNLADEEGDYGAARDFHGRAVAILESIAPDSLNVAVGLNNLGNVAWHLGELSQARQYYLRSLRIRQKLAPGSLGEATALGNLGNVAYLQGDVPAAHDYYRRSLELRGRLAPGSLDYADSLHALGQVARRQHDLAAARRYHEQALAVIEKIKPDSHELAVSLHGLGLVARDQGDLELARRYHERAVAISEKVHPDSLDLAAFVTVLGQLAKTRGDVGTARACFLRARAIREKLAPNSLALALSLRDLGRLAFEEGDLPRAVEHTTRAWTIVRQQGATVSGDEARLAFEAEYGEIGSQLVRFQIATNQPDAAFATLEEGRARALLQMIAERGVARRLAPAELWREFEVAQAAANRSGKLLEAAGRAEAGARTALEAEVAQQSAPAAIEDKRRMLSDREQQTAAAGQAYTRARVEAERRWADLRQAIEPAIPSPMRAAEARRRLPVDTLLLAFAVGEQGATLFAMQGDGPVQAFALAIPSAELASRVEFVRRSVARDAGVRGLTVPGADEVRVEAARTLYQKLFPEELRGTIEKAKRLLISPDGLLWDVPFAALVVNQRGRPQYLGLEKPLVYTQSLTAFAHGLARLEERTAAPSGAAVLVIGDPLYVRGAPGAQPPGAASRSSVPATRVRAPAAGEAATLSRDGEIPEPLPHAREEAERVAVLYGASAATGVQPTEAWFRQRAGGARIIHLATHGYFNPFRATSSGVRLAVPEREPEAGDTDNDGALQAWEIFTQFQLRADLVVLSACESGIGAKIPGEGLVGLTRAFQAAGAATVLATQWMVSDRSTAGAMVAFHRHLRQRMSKDEALRQAMRVLAADPATSHPYYWAAFTLVGDARTYAGIAH